MIINFIGSLQDIVVLSTGFIGLAFVGYLSSVLHSDANGTWNWPELFLQTFFLKFREINFTGDGSRIKKIIFKKIREIGFPKSFLN